MRWLLFRMPGFQGLLNGDTPSKYLDVLVSTMDQASLNESFRLMRLFLAKCDRLQELRVVLPEVRRARDRSAQAFAAALAGVEEATGGKVQQ